MAEEVEDEVREDGVCRCRCLGIVMLTPLYFLLTRRPPLLLAHQLSAGLLGFLAITMAWQLAFLVIGSTRHDIG